MDELSVHIEELVIDGDLVVDRTHLEADIARGLAAHVNGPSRSDGRSTPPPTGLPADIASAVYQALPSAVSRR